MALISGTILEKNFFLVIGRDYNFLYTLGFYKYKRVYNEKLKLKDEIYDLI